MGIIKDKINNWVKKATETATETVKQIAQDDIKDKIDIAEAIIKIIMFGSLTIGAIKGVSTPMNVVSSVKAEDVIKPVSQVAQAAAPVVQIFVGEGKGVRIE